MTVRELIGALAELPKEAFDLEVRTEGCDCHGDAGSVEVYNASNRAINLVKGQPPKDGDYVLICRGEDEDK